MAYEVQTPTYSGPFDLLLQLIVKDKIDLWEISLADIASSYIAKAAAMTEHDLETATEFLLIAATLLELKARRLLPTEAVPELDEELQGAYERDLLLARLVECHTFRAASAELQRLAAEAGKSHPRRVGLNEDRFMPLVVDLLEDVTPEDLRDAYLLATAPKLAPRVDVAHIRPITLTVDEAASELATELAEAGRLTFRQCAAGLADRIEMVVRFLAMLELVKRGHADLQQSSPFGEIVIVWSGEFRA